MSDDKIDEAAIVDQCKRCGLYLTKHANCTDENCEAKTNLEDK